MMKEHRGLLSLVLKQFLANTQAHHDSSMILFEVYFINAALLVIVMAIQQNQLCSKKAQKKGHGVAVNVQSGTGGRSRIAQDDYC